jgi:hypothetical protein
MATIGFEFAYMLDGSQNVPVVRDFILGVSADHLKGDLMLLQSDGFIDAVTTGLAEVTCVIAEEVLTADATAGTTVAKCQIITRGQVWRCSTDAATAATAFIGDIKRWDTVDKNTIDADDVTTGSMIVAEGEPTPADITNRLDDDGNVIGYVVFADTTFGNT